MHSVLHTVLHDVWCERDAGGSQSPRRWEDEPPRTSPGPMTGRTSELGVTGRGPTSASTAWAVPGHADAPVWLTKPQRPPAFVGFDMYHAIGSEQDAKNALNRPIPVPSKTAGGEPKKVLDGTSDSGTTGGRPASGSKTPPPPKTTPAATGTPSSGGTTDGSSAGTGGGGGAAAGPVAAGVTVGAAVVKGVGTAGPKAGTALAGQAEQTADAAAQTPSAPRRHRRRPRRHERQATTRHHHRHRSRRSRPHRPRPSHRKSSRR